MLKSIQYLLGSSFYPAGESISQQSLRGSPLAVAHNSVGGHCLAFAAILTRE
jgi:hypothetical protein